MVRNIPRGIITASAGLPLVKNRMVAQISPEKRIRAKKARKPANIIGRKRYLGLWALLGLEGEGRRGVLVSLGRAE